MFIRNEDGGTKMGGRAREIMETRYLNKSLRVNQVAAYNHRKKRHSIKWEIMFTLILPRANKSLKAVGMLGQEAT